MEDVRVMDDERAVGSGDNLYSILNSLTEDEAVSLAVSLIDTIVESVGENGFYGGVRPGNISYLPGGGVSFGEGSTAKILDLSPEELEFLAPEVF